MSPIKSVNGSDTKREDRLKKFLVRFGFFLLLLIPGLIQSGFFQRIPYYLQNPKIQVFSIILLAILLEAFPFLLLGAFVSGLIEVFVPEEKLLNFHPGNKLTSLISGSFLGLFFPTCSCGNVPIARRFLKKNMPLPMALTFLLSAPIINPIVILSTATAFRSFAVVLGRVGLAFLVSVIVGYILTSIYKNQSPLRENLRELDKCCHTEGSNWQRVFHHTQEDFLLMGRYLIFGAVLASLFQTFVPRAAILKLAGNNFASILLMEFLGISLSLCSLTDAFVAKSFTSLPDFSRVAFMVAGPMTNLSLIVLYLGTFKKKFVRQTCGLVVFFVFLFSLIWSLGR